MTLPSDSAAGAARRKMMLRYFDEVLPVEFEAINVRRARFDRMPVAPIPAGDAPPTERVLSAKRQADEPPFMPPPRGHTASGDPANPDPKRTRPAVIPCDANGLALSGGGIRAAAVSLGVLQALEFHHRLGAIDYLSTVSGGGYTGGSLTAAMTNARGTFPFDGDISDSASVAHLRNYSNYLVPRGFSRLTTYTNAAAVILRGILANLVLVLAVLLLAAIVTAFAYPDRAALDSGSFVPRLFWRVASIFGAHHPIFAGSLAATAYLAGFLAAFLVVWAVVRSRVAGRLSGSDTKGAFLFSARVLVIATLVVAFLDLQPLTIRWLFPVGDACAPGICTPKEAVGGVALLSFSGIVAFASSWIGRFLKVTEQARGLGTIVARLGARLAIVLAALILPLVLWYFYLGLSVWAIDSSMNPLNWDHTKTLLIYSAVFLVLVVVGAGLTANGYSLHRLFRDRLAKAFLFDPDPTHAAGRELRELGKPKLSELSTQLAPYQIFNAAMNVQGSREANRRGRNADFFMFTSDFIGSDLTMFAPTRERNPSFVGSPDMEQVDPRLDIGAVMAISGAAVSANMGGRTVGLLSPTLALLNIRLAYWLKNPRHVARTGRLRTPLLNQLSKFYLLSEIGNFLDETSSRVLLSDGGHVENLGAWELLKRGCQLIVVVDAETDPAMSFAALVKLQRYARIDLGIRIKLPWQEIARINRETGEAIANGPVVPEKRGPHCAVGRIFYENGAKGTLLYFKSSVTGDEKDYILDYKKRRPAFPQESTGDQFFTEEQFEVYRALGFHMVDGVLSGKDTCCALTGPDGWPDAPAAMADIDRMLPRTVVNPPAP